VPFWFAVVFSAVSWKEEYFLERRQVMKLTRNLFKSYGNLIMILLLTVGISVFSACGYEKDKETAATPSQPVTVAPKDLPSFYVDTINGVAYKVGSVVPVKPEINQIMVEGWGIDRDNKKAAGGVTMLVDGKTEFAATYGQERQDVANTFKENNYIFSGFTAKAPTAELAKGKHILTFKIFSADKKTSVTADWKIELDLQ
jgi:hypothetical protein